MGCSMKILTGIGTYEPEDFKNENGRKDAVAVNIPEKSNVLRNIFRI